MGDITDAELLSLAIELNVGPFPILNGKPFWYRHYKDNIRLNSVSVRNMSSCSPGEKERWAIIFQGSCLNKEGQWVYLGLPSERDEASLSQCRYASLQEAILYYRHWNDMVEEWCYQEADSLGFDMTPGEYTLCEYEKLIINVEDIPLDWLRFPPT